MRFSPMTRILAVLLIIGLGDIRAIAQPYQIRLVVNRNGEGYLARWIERDGQESESFPLVLPLTTEKN